ncbi:MAG: hypothetical protein EBR28_02660 [Planctomycetia bacterium]|nr:hypothetical protein [Planctomycetia bacterium]
MYDLLVIAAVLGAVWLGSTKGLHWATSVALEMAASFGLAFLVHEPVAAGVAEFIRLTAEPLLPQGTDYQWFAILVAFLLACWVPFGLLIYFLHRGDEDGSLDIHPLVDRIGGAVAGGVAGIVIAGCVLVTLSIVPLPGWLKPAGGSMFLDAGSLVLRAVGRLAPETHETPEGGWSLVLDGEPASRSTSLSAKLTNEPWCDVDGDSKQTEKDPFRDLDGNDTYTKDLYFVDVDGNGSRRIGVLDKYITGCWDSSLNSSPRERPDVKKPAPEEVAEAGAPAAAPGGQAAAQEEFEDDF